MPRGHCVGERLLVDQSAPSRIGDDNARFGPAQGGRVDEPGGLRRLRQVDSDEVRLGQQLVQSHQPRPELRGLGGGDIRVVGEDLGLKRLEPRSDQLADTPEAHHADRFLIQLHTEVRGALPLPRVRRVVRGRDLTGGGEQQRHSVLRRGVNVRSRRVHHEHAVGSGGLDVDVVQPDSGPSDDLEVRPGRQRLRVHLGCRAHEQRVSLGQGGEQRLPVGPSHPPHLDLIAEGGHSRLGELVGDQHDRRLRISHSHSSHGQYPACSQASHSPVCQTHSVCHTRWRPLSC